MSNFYDQMSPLERVLYHSSPRTHEYESLTGKVRRGERKKALEQIQTLWSGCTPDEALMIYDAYKRYAVGSNGTLVEIDVDSVPAEIEEWERNNTNPFLKHIIFFGRIGSTMGTLFFQTGGGG